MARRTHLGGCAHCSLLPPTDACLSRPSPPTDRPLGTLATPAISSAACAGHRYIRVSPSVQNSSVQIEPRSRQRGVSQRMTAQRLLERLRAAPPPYTVLGSVRCSHTRAAAGTRLDPSLTSYEARVSRRSLSRPQILGPRSSRVPEGVPLAACISPNCNITPVMGAVAFASLMYRN
ncbi:hypothetical protein PYCCODRAFT_124693 [Trametes coccinea BRFM310]|uniref:Uncharacterized protein n=1 Tax=Trametes coccinea (strain BRFM310) TaxID=1353009 RepID=A0A1Y2I8L9_TRAC3|nr:hypothetical protein PYCCODRAFT_124693 [Trametes coccinea BRFM310]